MKKCAILIVSCDKYADLWDSFFTCFWKNWPDCPYVVYLQSNTKKYTGKYRNRVRNVLTGKDENWSTSLKRTLMQIPEAYIFMWNEDLFFSAPVDSVLFSRYVGFLTTYHAKHIHYRNLPGADRAYTPQRMLGVYHKGAPYRSIVMGFWDRQYLHDLLLDGESPWSFEIMGSYRTSYDDGFFSAMVPVVNFVHMVEKGKWIARGVSYCKTHAIPIALSARPQTTTNTLKSQIQILYFRLLLGVRWKFRVKLMNILRKALVSY